MHTTTPLSVTLGITLLMTSCNDDPKYAVFKPKAEAASKRVEHPVHKLKAVSTNTMLWRLEFTGSFNDQHTFALLYKDQDGPVKNLRISGKNALSIGDTFLTTSRGEKRFKLVDVVSREKNPPLGRRGRNLAIIEDLSYHRRGERYELPLVPLQRELVDATQVENSATFILGNKKTRFEVWENSTFTLSAGEKDERVKLVKINFEDGDFLTRKATEVVVEFEDNGQTRTRTILVKERLEVWQHVAELLDGTKW